MADEPAAPASAPSAPAPSAPSPEPLADSPQSFDNLGSYDDLDSVEVSADSVEAAPDAAVVDQSTAAQSPPAPAEAPPPQQPQPVAAKPVQEQPQAQAPAPGPVEPDNSPQGLVQQLEQHRGAVIGALAAERFKLSPEEVSAIDTDAVGAIPHVMARVYYEAMQSTLLHIQNMVPQVVMNMIKAQKQSDDVENAFYGQFNTLDRMKHHQDVIQFAQLLRAQNPRISQQDLFSMVGAAVAAKHNLQARAANGNGAVPRPAQHAFRPAPAGATVRVVPETESPFAGLGKDWED